MDAVYPLLVVGTAEKHIQIYNLTNPTVAYKVILSKIPLIMIDFISPDYCESSKMADPSIKLFSLGYWFRCR